MILNYYGSQWQLTTVHKCTRGYPRQTRAHKPSVFHLELVWHFHSFFSSHHPVPPSDHLIASRFSATHTNFVMRGPPYLFRPFPFLLLPPRTIPFPFRQVIITSMLGFLLSLPSTPCKLSCELSPTAESCCLWYSEKRQQVSVEKKKKPQQQINFHEVH